MFHRRARAIFGDPLAEHDRAPGALHAIPSFVTVHREVTAADRRHLAAAERLELRFQRVDVRQRRAWRRVAPVEDRMHGDVAQTLAGREFEQGEKMIDMAVYAGVGE